MTEAAGAERGYRRLLAVYPPSFRHEQQEEMLAVLMAGARPGQRRPGVAEALDVIASGVRMRLRRARPESARQAWAGALTAFSVAAPLFVLVAGLLEVAVPYHLPPADRAPFLFRWAQAPRELGGLSLLHQPGFDIAVGGQVIIAALALLGLRRLALAAIVAAAAGFWIAAAGYGIPEPLWVLGAAAFPLEAVAVAAAPGYRRGLLRWREGVVLLLAAAAVQVLTLTSDARSDFARTGVLLRATSHSSTWLHMRQPGISGYVVLAVVLAAVAAGLAVALKINRYLLLLLALCYPVVMELAASVRRGNDLMGIPAPGHLAVLYLPPLLLVGIMIIAYTGLRIRAVRGRPESA